MMFQMQASACPVHCPRARGAAIAGGGTSGPGARASLRRLLATLVALLALVLAGSPSRAQSATGTAPPFSQQVLDELLAPIALYPDALLTQVLIASTYPLEVVQAARLLNQNSGLAPDALAAVAEQQPWDPSVIALTRFPSVLAMMDEKLDWTQKLGDAFLAQQAQVMDTVQALRVRAQAAGNLTSNAQQTVVVQERVIVIEPAQPQVVFVPFFDPMFVYGNWWWATPPRWVWAPPPRYWPPGWRPGWGPGVGWGRPIGAPPVIWHGRGPNWHNHTIVVNNTTINNNNVIINNGGRGSSVWTHNPGPRRGVSDPHWREGPPPGATTGPGGIDRHRPGGTATPPATRPAPTRPGTGGSAGHAPQARPLPAPTDDVPGPGSRPGARPRPGDATPPAGGRPPRTGAPAANPPNPLNPLNPPMGRPAGPAAPTTLAPAPTPPRSPQAPPSPRAPGADAPREPGTRPAPQRERSDRADRDAGNNRPGGTSPARATP